MVVNTCSAKCFHIISLGCPKNLTDSEVLMGHMEEAGYEYTSDPASADVIIVNTCAFLSSARKESIEVIKEMAAYKKKGACRQLLVAGCLPRYLSKHGASSEIVRTIHELSLQSDRSDKVRGIADGVIDSIALHDCDAPRIKATPPWTAYVKISEGCNNNCAYCLIPSIRGRLRNRKTSDVIKEVSLLAKRGVKEIIFVAQDTTAHPKFPEILKKTARIKGLRWIRIMYTHPKHITDKLIDVMAKEKKILKYIDLPMQHSSDKILKAMNRGYDRRHLEEVVAKLRKRMPSIAIRTTFIVGFPGETEKDFEDLKDYISKMKFDRVGVFPFSRENGTKAYNMKGQVPEALKRGRAEALMKLQAKISRQKNRGFVGNKMDILIEGAGLKPARTPIRFIGRTYRDAPEIDGVVRVIDRGGFKTLPDRRTGRPYTVCPGDIVKVRIAKAGTHDLEGRML